MLTSNIFSSIHQNEVTRIMPGKDHLKTSIVEEKDEKEGGAIYNPFDEEDDKEDDGGDQFVAVGDRHTLRAGHHGRLAGDAESRRNARDPTYFEAA